tara:strand:+ start:2987 stop:4336 length:1350 start_codon:yes stop_codon:yes gene_type:complete
MQINKQKSKRQLLSAGVIASTFSIAIISIAYYKLIQAQDISKINIKKDKNTVESIKTDCFYKAQPIGSSSKNKPLDLYIRPAQKSYVKRGGEKMDRAPGILIIGQIHGNETAGYHIANHIIQDNIFNNTEGLDACTFYVIPTLNPDSLGTERNNANDIDLNRNFSLNSDIDSDIQDETIALMEFMDNHPDICLTITVHGGALCVCYPLDAPVMNPVNKRASIKPNKDDISCCRGIKLRNNKPKLSGRYAKTIDDELYKRICTEYAKHHKSEYDLNMKDAGFPDGGIVNGSHWYEIVGSLGDYCYIRQGALSITVEASSDKNPPYAQLLAKEHKLPLVRTIQETISHFFHGIVKVEQETIPGEERSTSNSNCTVWFEENEKNSAICPIRTDKNGYFFRPCDPSPASYQIFATASKNRDDVRSSTVIVRAGMRAVLHVPRVYKPQVLRIIL